MLFQVSINHLVQKSVKYKYIHYSGVHMKKIFAVFAVLALMALAGCKSTPQAHYAVGADVSAPAPAAAPSSGITGGVAAAGQSCTDSDSGIMPEKFGTVSGLDQDGRNYAFADECAEVLLSEQYCDGSKPMSKTIKCSNGCKAGACA